MQPRIAARRIPAPPALVPPLPWPSAAAVRAAGGPGAHPVAAAGGHAAVDGAAVGRGGEQHDIRWATEVLAAACGWAGGVVAVCVRWAGGVLAVCVCAVCVGWEGGVLAVCVRWAVGVLAVCVRWAGGVLAVCVRWAGGVLCVCGIPGSQCDATLIEFHTTPLPPLTSPTHKHHTPCPPPLCGPQWSACFTTPVWSRSPPRWREEGPSPRQVRHPPAPPTQPAAGPHDGPAAGRRRWGRALGTAAAALWCCAWCPHLLPLEASCKPPSPLLPRPPLQLPITFTTTTAAAATVTTIAAALPYACRLAGRRPNRVPRCYRHLPLGAAAGTAGPDLHAGGSRLEAAGIGAPCPP